jgi:hypothetical protein
LQQKSKLLRRLCCCCCCWTGCWQFIFFFRLFAFGPFCFCRLAVHFFFVQHFVSSFSQLILYSSSPFVRPPLLAFPPSTSASTLAFTKNPTLLSLLIYDNYSRGCFELPGLPYTAVTWPGGRVWPRKLSLSLGSLVGFAMLIIVDWIDGSITYCSARKGLGNGWVFFFWAEVLWFRLFSAVWVHW